MQKQGNMTHAKNGLTRNNKKNLPKYHKQGEDMREGIILFGCIQIRERTGTEHCNVPTIYKLYNRLYIFDWVIVVMTEEDNK